MVIALKIFSKFTPKINQKQEEIFFDFYQFVYKRLF